MPAGIPEGYRTVTPFLAPHGAAAFIEFVAAAFGAEERFRVPNDDGSVGHAEVTIGDSILMLFDAKDDWPAIPSLLNLWVDDCDAVHDAAVAAGATVVTPLSTNAWGDRGSRVRDPFGNLWWIQTHVEDLSDDEIARRMSEPVHRQHMAASAETLDEAMRHAPARR